MTDRFVRPNVLAAVSTDVAPYRTGVNGSTPAQHVIVEHRYGARNRPVGFATVPHGFMRVDQRPDQAADKEGWEHARHGVVVYPRPLTDDEIATFELVPFLDAAAVDIVATQVAGEMAEYRSDYLDMVDEEPAFVRSAIMGAIERLYRHAIHVGAIEVFVDHVIGQLRDNTPSTEPPGPRP